MADLLIGPESERVPTGVNGGVAQLFLDPKQLVVFRDTVRPGRSAGLDLAHVERNRQVGDRTVPPGRFDFELLLYTHSYLAL